MRGECENRQSVVVLPLVLVLVELLLVDVDQRVLPVMLAVAVQHLRLQQPLNFLEHESALDRHVVVGQHGMRISALCSRPNVSMSPIASLFQIGCCIAVGGGLQSSKTEGGWQVGCGVSQAPKTVSQKVTHGCTHGHVAYGSFTTFFRVLARQAIGTPIKNNLTVSENRVPPIQ